MSARPTISLVVATLGRKEQFAALLASIEAQPYRPVEVVVVDQNVEPVLDEVLRSSALAGHIVHLRVPARGSSYARNRGAEAARGDILAFPDDDAELFPETLDRALAVFEATGSALVSGKCVDHARQNTVMKWVPEASRMSWRAHDCMFAESTLLIRREVFAAYPFDETLGAGVFHGAGEGNDLIRRLLAGDVAMAYDPVIQFYHPDKVVRRDTPEEVRRAFAFRCGYARYCTKHGLYWELLVRTLKIALYLPWVMLVAPSKRRYYLAELAGIAAGLIVP